MSVPAHRLKGSPAATASPLRGMTDAADEALVDVVDTWAQARSLAAPPLVVREGLRELLGTPELPEVRRIDEGHSNSTFIVQTPEFRCILRRPPRPPFEPKAHDVLREYRFLSALRNQPVRVPATILACEDPARIGAPFYLMEVLDGVALRDRLPPSLDRSGEPRRIAEELVDGLVELHAVDPAGMALGRPSAGRKYLSRQLDLWRGQWERLQTRKISALEEVTRRLRERVPVTGRISIVHGDYKLDNVLFDPRAPTRLLAILDWEMATLGDPLADLGYLTATWVDPGEDPDRINGISRVTAHAGFPPRRRLAERYAERSGLPLDGLAWYQGLALWKLAILLEASYRRYLAGTASDPFFPTLAAGVPKIAEQALAALEGRLV